MRKPRKAPPAGTRAGVIHPSVSGPPPVHRPSAAALRFVEDFALQMEADGLPRMAGRVLAWLLICDPPEQTASNLADVLSASKGSISSTTTQLERAAMIERFARPGDRRDYYRVRPNVMSNLMSDGLRRIQMLRETLDRGLDLLKGRPPAARERLRDVYEVITFYEREFPDLLKRWDAQRRRTAGNG